MFSQRLTLSLITHTFTHSFTHSLICPSPTTRDMSVPSIRVSPHDGTPISSHEKLKQKVVHFQRHATGWHNVYGEERQEEYLREDLHDAALSEGGLQECHHCATATATATAEGEGEGASGGVGAQLLLVSPMRRTLQTATLCFPHLRDRVPWLALESLREVTGMHPCDRRLPIHDHAESHPHVDFSLIEDVHDPIYQKYTDAGTREPDEHVMSRCEDFLSFLKTRTESEIVVCTHSAYLRVLFNKVFADQAPEDQAKYKNCEIRSYVVSFE